MKKVPVVRITTPDAATELAGLPLNATVAMADVAAAMREGLLAFSTAAGLVVMQQMLTEELASIVGRKHARLSPEFGGVRCVGLVLQACDLGLLIVVASFGSRM